MKYLKTFEETNDTRSGLLTSEDIVKKYCEKHPEFSDFFNDFLERYPNDSDFQKELYDYSDEDDYSDEGWSPEGEVQMLDERIGNYPGDDIWVDFHNEMLESSWYFRNTPLGHDTNKYNL
jgi:hypothetical protein